MWDFFKSFNLRKSSFDPWQVKELDRDDHELKFTPLTRLGKIAIK